MARSRGTTLGNALRRPDVLAAALIVAAACGSAPPATSPTPSRSPEDAIQRMVRAYATENDVSMVALVETGGHVWPLAVGLDRNDHDVDPSARFDMGSTAKTYEATVVLQLVQEERLSLDDSVEEWIPEWVEGASQVQIRHLLNHTSGLGGERRPFHAVSPPGEYSYSNLGYGLLGEIVEKITGHSVNREIRDRILEPLGLDVTWTIPKGSSVPWLGARYGSCRNCVPDEGRGGPVTTTSELARFFQALLGGELLGDDMLAVMTDALPSDIELSAGHGLFRFDLPCGVAYGHGGDATYYANQVLVSPDGSTVVVLAQGRSGWFPIKTLAEELYCQAT